MSALGCWATAGPRYSKLAKSIIANVQRALVDFMNRIEGFPNIRTVNTDGIIVSCPHSEQGRLSSIIEEWCHDWGLSMSQSGIKVVLVKNSNASAILFEDDSVKITALLRRESPAIEKILEGVVRELAVRPSLAASL